MGFLLTTRKLTCFILVISGNILFDELGDAKITDFGLSKIVDAVDSSGGMELPYGKRPLNCGEAKCRKIDGQVIGICTYDDDIAKDNGGELM